MDNFSPYDTNTYQGVSAEIVPLSRVTLTGKRILDVIGSLALIVLTSPIFLIVALVVALDGGPVFFRHIRIGQKGERFGCLKFRTMILGAESCLTEYLEHHPDAKAEWQIHQKLEFDPRITPIGRILRETSLDELPQLFNILRGEMSLVGPRPVTNDELSRYGNSIKHYLSVRPGLTGPWQISGRNNVAYADRVALDRNYVSQLSIMDDVMILLRTPLAVLSRKGAK